MVNKYTNARALYTPFNENDQRGELLFKVLFNVSGPTLDYRAPTDQIAQNFFKGLGGWTNPTNASNLIKKFIQNSDLQLDLFERPQNTGGQSYAPILKPQSDVLKAAKFIFNSMKSVAQGGTDNVNNLLKQLYDNVYLVDVKSGTSWVPLRANGGATVWSNYSTESVKDPHKRSWADGEIRVRHLSSSKRNAAYPGSNDWKITTAIRVMKATGVTPVKYIPVSRQHIRFDSQIWGGRDNFIYMGQGGDNGLIRFDGNLVRIASTFQRFWNPGEEDKVAFEDWDIIQFLTKNLSSATPASTEDVFTAIMASTSGGPSFVKEWRRDDKGVLETKDVNGNWISINDWAKSGNKCTSVGANNNCDGYVNSCLAAGPSSERDGKPESLLDANCLAVIQSMIATGNGWKVTKDEIKKVNPKMAFIILKNLGFKGKKVKGDGLRKVEPVSEWQKRVQANELTDDNDKPVPLVPVGTFTVAQIQAMCKNDNLTKFLDLLVGFIDSNPAILNPGASGKGLSLDPKDEYGLSRPRGNDKTDFSDIRHTAISSIDALHLHVQGLAGVLGIGRPLMLLSGGGLPGYLAPAGTHKKVKFERLSQKLKEVYDHYIQRLKAMNKTLSVQTVSKVNDVFNTLKEKEDELLKWVEYIEKYYEIKQMEGNVSAEAMTQQDLEQAYEKYEKNVKKLRKRSVNLIDIIHTLANATNDAEKGESVALSM
jgi:flagellin-specific chaperone FliS